MLGNPAEELHISLTCEQCVDRRIEALGFRTEDVQHVIMSQLHWDHTGGMYLLLHAQFHVMTGELQYSYWPLTTGPVYRREDIEATPAFAWNQIEGGELDFFGDGSLVILRMPGHTAGNASLVVRLANRTIILAADMAHLRSGYLDDRPMPSDWDTRQSVQSIRRLKQIARSLDAMVWIAHDPTDWEELRHAPAFYD